MPVHIGSFVNRVLRPLGIRLQRVSATAPPKRKAPWHQHMRVLQEFHDYLVERLFSDLPPVEKRAELLGTLHGMNTIEAMWILNGLHQCLSLEGDVCEFGVAAGTTSTLMANDMRLSDKTLWLFDSFEGLPRPSDKDQLIDDVLNLGTMDAYEGAMSFPATEVISRLEAIDFPSSRVRIVPGFIEETIKTASLPERICFALVDFDFYEPIRVALDFLSDHLSDRGQIVVDDYGAFSTGAQIAVDEFVDARKGAFTLELPPHWAGDFVILTKRFSPES